MLTELTQPRCRKIQYLASSITQAILGIFSDVRALCLSLIRQSRLAALLVRKKSGSFSYVTFNLDHAYYA